MDEQLLWIASKEGRVTEVKNLLRIPTLDVNWESSFGFTALMMACTYGKDAVVQLLLEHASIDVNKRTGSGQSPFWFSCRNGHTACARLLLKDNRLLPNEVTERGHSPLSSIAFTGNFELLQWWIASGRQLDLGGAHQPASDVIRIARDNLNADAAKLLTSFKKDPEATRHEVREQLGYYKELTVEVFALVVFLCDGLVSIKPNSSQDVMNAVRFFRIARQLPLDLQMVLCQRLGGSGKNAISSSASEAAFWALARRHHQLSS